MRTSRRVGASCEPVWRDIRSSAARPIEMREAVAQLPVTIGSETATDRWIVRRLSAICVSGSEPSSAGRRSSPPLGRPGIFRVPSQSRGPPRCASGSTRVHGLASHQAAGGYRSGWRAGPRRSTSTGRVHDGLPSPAVERRRPARWHKRVRTERNKASAGSTPSRAARIHREPDADDFAHREAAQRDRRVRLGCPTARLETPGREKRHGGDSDLGRRLRPPSRGMPAWAGRIGDDDDGGAGDRVPAGAIGTCPRSSGVTLQDEARAGVDFGASWRSMSRRRPRASLPRRHDARRPADLQPAGTYPTRVSRPRWQGPGHERRCGLHCRTRRDWPRALVPERRYGSPIDWEYEDHRWDRTRRSAGWNKSR